MHKSHLREERALASGGASNSSVLYERVVSLIDARHSEGGTVIDAGCGKGTLASHIANRFDRYLGLDIVDHLTPAKRISNVEFVKVDFDSQTFALPDGLADFTCSLETIEHLENPRAFLRELVRLTKQGGYVIVTTPNQLSFQSKACLIIRNEFVHFQERPGLYPAHLSPLLEIDLIRMARENDLKQVEIVYTGDGRIPGMTKHWPQWLCSVRNWRGRAFSDNVVMIGKK